MVDKESFQKNKYQLYANHQLKIIVKCKLMFMEMIIKKFNLIMSLNKIRNKKLFLMELSEKWLIKT